MSVQLGFWDGGSSDPEYGLARQGQRASLAREMRYLLTAAHNAGKGMRISPSGIAHSLGVCLIEDWIMARGGKADRKRAESPGMPRFVDVRLDSTQKQAFVEWYSPRADQVQVLQQFTDSGYRVGVTWSGEHQSYTVSATCRDAESPNNGLCMTAFAGELGKAIALLWYKHQYVAKGDWTGVGAGGEGDFG